MSPLAIRTVTEHDGPAISRLFSTVFNKEMTADQWHWKYRLPERKPICSSVAATPDGEIIGHVGAIPIEGTDCGLRLPTFQLSDAMVAPGYRGRDLFQDLLLHVGRTADSLAPGAVCYAYAGPDSTRIGIKKGILHDVGPVVGYSFDTEGLKSSPFGWSIGSCSLSDRRLPLLWERCYGRFTAFSCRSREFIEWRYENNPFHHYGISIFRYFFRPAGWCIWSDEEDGVRLVDLCIGEGHVDAALALFAGTYARGRKVQFWFPEDCIKSVKLPLKSEETLIHLMLLNHRPDKIPAGSDKRFFYTMGDVDIY